MPSRSAAFNGASVARRQDDIPTALESGSLFDWRKYLRIHPAAELFPLMKEKDIEGFNALVENIRVHGLAEKIVGWSSSEGVSVLDGRNRLDALAQLGLLCEMPDHLVGIKKWTGKEWSDQGVTRIAGHDGAFRNLYDHNGNPYDIALSLNVHRRHLTAEQKRDLIAKLLKAKPEASNLSIAKQIRPTTRQSPRSGMRWRLIRKFRRSPTGSSATVARPEGASRRRSLASRPCQSRR
jgi:hypothetical protein